MEIQPSQASFDSDIGGCHRSAVTRRPRSMRIQYAYSAVRIVNSTKRAVVFR